MREDINDLINISQFYGKQKDYVIAGGGNTSYKNEELLYIKASGVSLSDIGENGFCILDRKKLAELPGMKLSEDPIIREEQVKNALMDSRLNPESGLRPSVETSLHNLFEYTYVVHTHPTLVNGLMCSLSAGLTTAKLFGQDALYIPYSDPGFVLFTIIREEILAYRERRGSDPKMVFIQNHGVFVAANSIGEIRDIYHQIHTTIGACIAAFPEDSPMETAPILAEILPAARMMLSADRPRVVRAFNNRRVASFIRSREEFAPIARTFTPDHMVYCLSEYLYISEQNGPESLIAELEAGISEFKAKKGSSPKVIFVQNAGVIVAEDSPVSLEYLEGLVIDFTAIALLTENFGGPHHMTDAQVAFIENWEVENYRKKVSLGEKPKGRAENKIVVITGSAQGFGAGIAELMFAEGANVVIADLNAEKGKQMADSLNNRGKKNRAFFIGVNVSDPASVEALVRQTVLTLGGIDVMISNAGILRAGGLEEMSPETFDLMTRVNYNAYFYCVKYASAVMKLQYRFSPEKYFDIIQINSKSGLKGSNKNFAYAGGKFGGIGLTQSFALELMPFHTKVNAICPGNFFDGPLWSDPENGLFVQYLKAGKIPGARTVEDVKRHYEKQVPAGRGCTPADVVKAIYYVTEQDYETGQAIPVTGGQEMLN